MRFELNEHCVRNLTSLVRRGKSTSEYFEVKLTIKKQNNNNYNKECDNYRE